MPLEKAFAIHARPAVIWRTLYAELEQADPNQYVLEQEIPNQLLAVRVQLQPGITARTTYRITRRDEYTEVSAIMEPWGFRYSLFQVLTFGRSNLGYELALVEGLANLKRVTEEAEKSEAPES